MDFLDNLDPTIANAYRQAALGRQRANDPSEVGLDMTPDEQTSWLSRRLDESLGGLSYIGKLFDKYTGARAIRGVLGGRPEELASLLPGSDTLGLTKEENVVQGTDLLAKAGLITHGDQSWQNQLAGFGAEVALDPSSYLGIGALTKAGKAAGAAGGKLAPKLSERIAAGHAGLLDVGVPLGSMFGLERTPLLTGQTGEAIARNFWKPVTVPAEAGALAAERYIGQPIEKLIGINPVTAAGNTGDAVYRWGRSQFNTPTMGAFTREGQKVAEDYISPEFEKLKDPVMRQFADAFMDLDKIGLRGPEVKRAAEKYLVAATEHPEDLAANVAAVKQHYAGEGIGMVERKANTAKILNDPNLTDAEKTAEMGRAMLENGMEADKAAKNALWIDTLAQQQQAVASKYGPNAADFATHLTPDDMQVLGKHATAAKDAMKEWQLQESNSGINSPTLTDMIDYFARRTAVDPKAKGESAMQYFRRGLAQMRIQNENQMKRLDEFHNIPGGTLKLNEMIADPRLSGPNREAATGMTDLAVQDHLIKELSGTTRGRLPADSPFLKQAEKLGDKLKGMHPYWAENGSDFFNLDFAENLKRRGINYAKAMATQNGVYRGLTEFAKPIEGFAQGEAMAVPELLAKMGLTGRNTPESFPKSWEILAGMRGHMPDEVAKLGIKNDIAADMLKFGKVWQQPEEMKPVLEAWAMANNLFKASVTGYFPAFYTRNIMSGLFNMWRDDALSSRGLTNATQVKRGGFLDQAVVDKLYPGMTRETATREFVKEHIVNEIAFGKRQNRTLGETGGALAEETGYNLPPMTGKPQPWVSGTGGPPSIVGDFARGFLPESGKWEDIRKAYNPFGVAGVTGPEDTNVVLNNMRGIGQSTEDIMRSGHYLELRMQGVGSKEAADRVNKYHINYSSSTAAEKAVWKQIFPWWMFSSRNLPVLLDDLASKPGKLSGATRLISGVRDPSEFVPAFIGEGASIPIPGAPEGQQRYISSFGLPLEDELPKTIGSLLKGDITRTFQQGIGMANPLVKLPFEQAFGTQLYSGRKLEDLRPSQTVSLGGLLPDQVARGLTEVISNSPAARGVHTIDTLLDPRKSIGSTLINMGTGVRLSDVETDRQQELAAREMVKNQLRGSAEARVREEVYVPQNLRGQLDPNERLMLELMRSTNQRVVDRQNLEKANAGR